MLWTGICLKGIREALGDKADKLLVKTASYEVTDPSADAQVVELQASGANVFMNLALGKGVLRSDA